MNSRQRFRGSRVSWILALVTAFAGGAGTAFPQGSAERPRAALAVWDTGAASAVPLAPEAIEQKTGWSQIANNQMAPAFRGDAVISNGRVLVVARHQGTGVELYSLGLGKPVWRACL